MTLNPILSLVPDDWYKIIPNVYREWLEKENKSMSGNSVGENPLLVREIEGEYTIKMKLIDGPE